MKKIIFFVLAVLFMLPAFAQVGINNSSPDSSAVLDLQSNSNNQGLLVPRLSSDQIAAISNPAEGLLAYNTNLDLFCFYDGTNWYSLRTFRQILNWGEIEPPQDMDADIYAGKNMGIGYSGANSKMSLNGNLSVGANEVAPTNGAFIAGQVRIGSNVGFKKLEVDGEMHSTDSINTDKKICEKGYPLLPAGSIIMWAGTNVPDGWHLCDGDAFNASDYPELYTALGSNTFPDLRGRFIMGYGSHQQRTLTYNGDSTFTTVNPTIGPKGGYDKVAINEGQMPTHNHHVDATVSDHYTTLEENPLANGGTHEDGDNRTFDAWITRVIDVDTDEAGGNQAHENRPPYYVLAFIMKE